MPAFQGYFRRLFVPIMINCIVIDDEPLAKTLVSSFVERTPFLRLAACFTNAWEAYYALDGLAVQLIFLDIEMPHLNGLQFARILLNGNRCQCPSIIFTTAHNQYALESYKVNALDYLLKPFNYDDFLRAAGKARENFLLREAARKSAVQVGGTVQVGDAALGSLFLKVEHQLVQVTYGDVQYVEGFRDYIKIYIKGLDKPLMSLTTLKNIEERLPAGQFMRVHKSFIVSLGKIGSITKSAVHIGNTVIPIGDQYRDGFKQTLIDAVYDLIYASCSKSQSIAYLEGSQP